MKARAEVLTASGKPRKIDVVTLDLLRIDEEEDLFCLLEASEHSLSLGKVEVERVVIEEVAFDGVQVDQDIVKLPQEEETGSHTLASWDGVWGGGARHCWSRCRIQEPLVTYLPHSLPELPTSWKYC